MTKRSDNVKEIKVKADERESETGRSRPDDPSLGKVLVVDDDTNLVAVLTLELGRLGFDVESASTTKSAMEQISLQDFDVVLLDLRLGSESGMDLLESFRLQGVTSEVILLTGHGTIESAVEAMRAGAREYLTKPCRLEELEIHLRKAVQSRRVREENRELKQYLANGGGSRPILTVESKMNSMLESLDRVASSDVPVLIEGESGTGKELLARQIHHLSPVKDQPFLPVNCAVLRAELLESELFGHEKGAFTGAVRRKLGLFEICSNGTLFLDEIGEIDEGMQAKLLRVYQSGEFRRVGSTETLFVNTRIVAATNKNLQTEVTEGRFREDLFFRLNVVTLEALPLRERPGDIEFLFRHFLAFYGRGENRSVTDEAVELLKRYSWPGNVRELENVVRRTLIFHDQDTVNANTVRAVLPHAEDSPNDARLTLAEVERTHILRVLLAQNNDKKSTAEILGISLKTIYNKLHSYGEI